MAPVSNPPPTQGAVSPQWQPPPQYQQYQPLPPAIAPNGQPLASFADRFLAYLIDHVIYLVVSLIWTIPFMIWWVYQFNEFFNEVANSPGFDPDQPGPPPSADFDGFLGLYVPMLLFVLATLVLATVYTYVYWVEMQMRRGGQTVGKRIMKIRVIPVDPAQAEVTRSGYVVRWAVQYLVGAAVPFFNLVDGLWQLWDKPLQQCLHDKAAKTVVVKVG